MIKQINENYRDDPKIIKAVQQAKLMRFLGVVFIIVGLGLFGAVRMLSYIDTNAIIKESQKEKEATAPPVVIESKKNLLKDLEIENETGTLKGNSSYLLSQADLAIGGGFMTFDKDYSYWVENTVSQGVYKLQALNKNSGVLKTVPLSGFSSYIHTYDDYYLLIQNTGSSIIDKKDSIILIKKTDGQHIELVNHSSDIHSMVSDGNKIYYALTDGVYEYQIENDKSSLIFKSNTEVMLKDLSDGFLTFINGNEIISFNTQTRTVSGSLMFGGHPTQKMFMHNNVYVYGEKSAFSFSSVKINKNKIETPVFNGSAWSFTVDKRENIIVGSENKIYIINTAFNTSKEYENDKLGMITQLYYDAYDDSLYAYNIQGLSTKIRLEDLYE